LEGGGDRSRTLRRSVRETAVVAIGVNVDTNPTRSGEEHGGRLPLKKRLTLPWPRRGRREMRRHGGAFSPAAAYHVLPVRGTGAATAPEFYSGPVRRGESTRNTRPGTSSRETELKGESNANVADSGIGTQNSSGAGAENILHGDRDDLRRRRPHGRLRGEEGVFSLAVSPFT
jgi:hypothetical protein